MLKKALIIVCIAIAVVGTISYSIQRKEAKQRHQLQQELITTIEENKSGNDNVVIHLNQINSFTWNKVYIFTPYTGEEIINKQLAFKWSKADLVQYTDSFNLVVFVKGKKVVRYVLLPRRYGSFVVDYKNEFSPNETLEIEPFH